MGTDVIKSCDSLQQELDRAKNTLVGLNDNIRRIIGRDPKDSNLRGDRKRRNDHSVDRSRNRECSSPPAKSRNQDAKSIFSRLSGPPTNPSASQSHNEEHNKPRIFSRVIRELPSRQEIVTAQGPDPESRARNRRMFGSLIGTLHKFCQEESRLKQKEEQKAMVEKKVEEQEIKERANLKKERENLFIDRRRKQIEIRKLELKMYRFRDFEAWEKSKKDLVHYIRTKTKPPIYFLPKVHNKKTEALLAEHRAVIEKEIESRREALNEEILNIESRYKFREDVEIGKLQTNGTQHPSKHDRQKSQKDEDDDEDDDEDEEPEEQEDEHIEANDSESEERKVCVISGNSNENLTNIKIKIQNDIKDSNNLEESETGNSSDRTAVSIVVMPSLLD